MAVMTSSAFDQAPFEGKAQTVLADTMILDHEANGVAHKYDALFDEPEPPSFDPSTQPTESSFESPAATNGNGNHATDENQPSTEAASAPILGISSGIAPISQFLPETTAPTSISTAVEAPTSDLREDTDSVPTGKELEIEVAGTTAGEMEGAPRVSHAMGVSAMSQEVSVKVSEDISQDVSQEVSQENVLEPVMLEYAMDTTTDSFMAPATEVLEPSGGITTLAARTHTPAADQLKVETKTDTTPTDIPFTQSPITADHEMADAPSAGKVRLREDDDEEAPSAKRTKTDDETEQSTEFKVPEAPASNNTQTVDETSMNANQPSIQAAITAYDWPLGSMNKAQNKFLLERVRNTKKIKVAFAFKDPVDPVALNIPQYNEIIKNPMDLTEMEKKLKEDQYSSIVDFMKDLDLIVDNTITFNGMAHPISQAGLNMRAYFLKGMGKMPREDIEQPVQKKPKKPTVATASKPRRESRAAVVSAASPVATTATAVSPQQTSWPLGPEGMPVIRRDSSNANDRPKREIHRPPPKDLPYNSVKPKKKKYQLELKFCETVLSELMKPKNFRLAGPFLHPVDPVALNIPTYLRIIKKPMDLSTIEKNLKEGLYQTSKDFHADVKLMFDNCFKFNPPEDGVHKMGKEFQNYFNDLWEDKPRWIEENGQASQPPSPVDSEEEEEEEEVDQATEQLLQLQKEMAKLNEKAQLLIQQKAGKRASPKAPTKKGSKSSTKAAPKRKSSTMVPPPKASKPRRPEREPAPLTFAQKQEISDGISTLGDVDMRKAVQIIRNGVPHLATVNDDEMEIDMDEINDATLRKLLSFIKGVRGPKGVVDDDFAPQRRVPKAAAPPKPKKNKPMGKEEQENKIKQIRQQLQNFDANASNSDQSPVAQNDDSSEDEEESGSESEEE